jgi:hypothetical protein
VRNKRLLRLEASAAMEKHQRAALPSVEQIELDIRQFEFRYRHAGISGHAIRSSVAGTIDGQPLHIG